MKKFSKKLLTVFLAFTLAVGVMSAVPMTVIAKSVNNLTNCCSANDYGKRYGKHFFYRVLSKNSVEITHFNNTAKNITIPATINGKCVTTIGTQAFCGSNVESVVILGYVKTIGVSAFECCKKLKSLNIAPGVKSIEPSAFAGCSSLKKVVVPNSVMYIGDAAFANCENLASIILPDNKKYTTIGFGFASDCLNLKFINIPSNVKYINNSAFANCYSLADVKLPDGIKEIGSCAFMNCTALKSVLVPESVVRILKFAFGYKAGKVIDGFAIKSYAGSAAQKYAYLNNIRFIKLD